MIVNEGSVKIKFGYEGLHNFQETSAFAVLEMTVYPQLRHQVKTAAKNACFTSSTSARNTGPGDSPWTYKKVRDAINGMLQIIIASMKQPELTTGIRIEFVIWLASRWRTFVKAKVFKSRNKAYPPFNLVANRCPGGTDFFFLKKNLPGFGLSRGSGPL